jgi:hypothetical protein
MTLSVTLTPRHFPVIWKEAEDGRRQVELSFSNISNVHVFFRRLLLHVERRRRPATSPRRVMLRRVTFPRLPRSPRQACSPRCSPHHRGLIKIRIFARVGRRPCGNFDFLARHAAACHISHVHPCQVMSRHVTSPTSTLARSRRVAPHHVSHIDPRQVTSRDLYKFVFSLGLAEGPVEISIFSLATPQHVTSPTSTLARSSRITAPTSNLVRSRYVDPRQGTLSRVTSPTSTLARSGRGTSQLNCGIPVFHHLPAGGAHSRAGNARNDALVERPVVRRGHGRPHRGPILREGIVGQGSD